MGLFSRLMHGDQYHLMSNMFILMIFGKMAEEDMGAIGERRNFEETSWGGGGGGGGDACGTLP